MLKDQLQVMLTILPIVIRSWAEIGKTPNLEILADKLQEGNQYIFRVAAENQSGLSDYVEIPEPITAKNPFSKLPFSRYYLNQSLSQLITILINRLHSIG